MSSSIRHPQQPRMCDQCALLCSHKHRHSPAPANHSVCGACTLTSDSIPPPRPCPACIIYALLYQNTFLIRWDDITATAPPSSPLQAHRSIHHPTPPPSALPIHPHRPPAPTISLPHHVSQPLIDLTLTAHTIAAIEAVMLVDTSTHPNTHIHITHPTIPLTIGHMRRLRDCL